MRPSSQVAQTSSPWIEYSKASNFERFVFDVVGRDSGLVKALWSKVDAGGEFDLAATPYFANVQEYGFVSGSSTHADRLATIRRVYKDYGVTIDTHTADGLKVGLEQRQAGIPLVCLETALPVKFADTIREALGRDPDYPPGCENLESLPQRFELMDADATAIKAYLARHSRL